MAESKSNQEDTKADAPEKYATDDLIARSVGFLEVDGYVAAGALYGAPKNLTIADAKKRVKDWLKSPAVDEEA